jgi:hypothetical protein
MPGWPARKIGAASWVASASASSESAWLNVAARNWSRQRDRQRAEDEQDVEDDQPAPQLHDQRAEGDDRHDREQQEEGRGQRLHRQPAEQMVRPEQAGQGRRGVEPDQHVVEVDEERRPPGAGVGGQRRQRQAGEGGQWRLVGEAQVGADT